MKNLSRSKKILILVAAFLVAFLIGGAISDATGSDAILPIVLIPVALLWLALFPIKK